MPTGRIVHAHSRGSSGRGGNARPTILSQEANGIRLSIFPVTDGWSWKAEKDEKIVKIGSYHITVDIAQFCAEWMVENA